MGTKTLWKSLKLLSIKGAWHTEGNIAVCFVWIMTKHFSDKIVEENRKTEEDLFRRMQIRILLLGGLRLEADG